MVFDWVTFGEPLSFWQMLLRIVAAVIFGAIIGIEREMKNRPASMRTHVLVCLGAALIGLVEQQTIAHVVALGSTHINVSVGRLTAQIVSGCRNDHHRRPADLRPDHRGFPVVCRLPGPCCRSGIHHHGTGRMPGGHDRAEADAADRACKHLQAA